MIERLTGTIIEKTPPWLVLDVNGVGYEIEVSMQTFYCLAEVNEKATIYTHLVVREDAQLLFGFQEKQERRLFRELIRISGVGPKLALVILSGMSGAELQQAVEQEDSSLLVRVPGIGKKTAERLIVELKDRVTQWSLSITTIEQSQTPHSTESSLNEALSALISLGYKAPVAKKMLNGLDSKLASSELIRLALKNSVN